MLPAAQRDAFVPSETLRRRLAKQLRDGITGPPPLCAEPRPAFDPLPIPVVRGLGGVDPACCVNALTGHRFVAVVGRETTGRKDGDPEALQGQVAGPAESPARGRTARVQMLALGARQ